MEIFDGVLFAQQIEERVAEQLNSWPTSTVKPTIAAVLFTEDQGSQLYTRLKREAAARLGIEYQVFAFSLRSDVNHIITQIKDLNLSSSVTGIIIQKPWKKTWEQVAPSAQAFQEWWAQLVSQITVQKDVDGLQPQTLQAIAAGTWQSANCVLPATCQAVLSILEDRQLLDGQPKVAIIGKSDLLGKPLADVLRGRGLLVDLMGRTELDARRKSGVGLKDATVIISATGHAGCITGDLVSPGVAIIDVGEPKPDVAVDTLPESVTFLTPVPGGVGPITVSCLMDNAIKLVLHPPHLE